MMGLGSHASHEFANLIGLGCGAEALLEGCAQPGFFFGKPADGLGGEGRLGNQVDQRQTEVLHAFESAAFKKSVNSLTSLVRPGKLPTSF